MIFSRELADLIVNGRKTQARRPVPPGETEPRYRPGRDYAIETSEQHWVADPKAVKGGRTVTIRRTIDRLYITSTHQATVGDLEHQDALREGFENIGAFIDHWQRLTRRRTFDPDQPVWVLSFELYRGQDVTWQPARDTVRRLRVPWDPGVAAGGPVMARDRAPEPEAVDVADIAPRWVREAGLRHDGARGWRDADRACRGLDRKRAA
jgi:hypothetical protein